MSAAAGSIACMPGRSTMASHSGARRDGCTLSFLAPSILADGDASAEASARSRRIVAEHQGAISTPL